MALSTSVKPPPCGYLTERGLLDRAVRCAELDHLELTITFEVYLHASGESLGLRLSRRDFAEGEVRAAYWAGG